jgi:uncharacterized membrane protein YGL010W
LADNFLQLFNAPLFLTTELLWLTGARQDLRQVIETRAQPVPTVPISGELRNV